MELQLLPSVLRPGQVLLVFSTDAKPGSIIKSHTGFNADGYINADVFQFDRDVTYLGSPYNGVGADTLLLPVGVKAITNVDLGRFYALPPAGEVRVRYRAATMTEVGKRLTSDWVRITL